jgi:hypothetical protein
MLVDKSLLKKHGREAKMNKNILHVPDTFLIWIIFILVNISIVAAQNVVLENTTISDEQNISANSVTIGPEVTISETGNLNLKTNTMAIKPHFYIRSGGKFQLISTSNPVSIEKENSKLPEHFELKQNYPNPFNPSTQISFSLPFAENVEIIIYNISGQKVKTLMSGQKEAGNHTITWNGTSSSGERVSSGIYFYRLTTGKNSMIKKMTLIK